MSPRSVREYAEAVRPRYRRARRHEKGHLLTEFCQTTGYHRKAAVRCLAGRRRRPAPAQRGRPRLYGPDLLAPLERLWEISGRLCGKRLAPFLPELLAALERHGEVTVAPDDRAALHRMSAATLDRRLRAARQREGRPPTRGPRPLPALLQQIPIRTFGDWQKVAPGACQADLVLHCAETTQGFYLATLVVVDVATGWSECEPVWGVRDDRVGAAVHHLQARLPMPLRALHTDNGQEFLNYVLTPYCRRAGILQTRGRPARKNDQAYAEQKIWIAVRRLIGYDRYSTRAAFAQLQHLYGLWRLCLNFFHPLAKLVGKTRAGATVTKHYDRARTPYRRLLETSVLNAAQRAALEQQYLALNPVRLRAEIDQALQQLWSLADRPVR